MEEENKKEEKKTEQEKDVASRVSEAVSQIDTDELKKNATGYWNWLVTSWKNPTEVQMTGRYAGIVSLALESLFLIVGIGRYINSVVNAAVSSVSSVFGGSSYSSSGMGFGFYLTGFIVFICASLVMVGIAYLFHGHEEGGFLAFTNRVAHYSNVILIADVLFILFGFIVASSPSVALLAMLLLASSWLEWNVALVFAAQNERRLNKVYSGTLLMIANIIVLFVTFLVLGSIAGDKLQDVMQSFTGN